MKKTILLLISLALTSCASLLSYNYSIGFKNTGTNLVYCYSGHTPNGNVIAPGYLKSNSIKTVAGPFNTTPNSIFTFQWQTVDGATFTNSIDLRKTSIPASSYIVFTINASNQLGAYLTKEPHNREAKITQIETSTK